MNPLEFETLARAENELWWFRGMRKILFGLLDRDRAAAGARPRALEAGCGTGHFAAVAEGRYGWPVFPTDLSWAGLSRGRRAGAYRLVQADIRTLPYASRSFDLAFCLDVLVHFERGSESAAIAELARILKPGGRMVIRVSALDALHSRHSTFTHERQRFTRRRLVEVVEAHGIRVLRCTYANSLLMPVALARFRIWEPLTGAAPQSGTAPVPRWLDKLLYLPLAIEAKCIGWGIDFPLGQSLILVGEKA
jgi:SAM-dependent methyltransferase